MSPEELERWVLLAADVSSPQQQWEATNMLNQWISTAVTDPVTVSRTLISVLRVSRHEPVTFYALTTLQRMHDIPHPSDQMELRTLLLLTSNSSISSSYLVTKVGVVLAKLIRLDFATALNASSITVLGFESTANFLQDLQHKTSPLIFLRTMEALFEDVEAEVDPLTTKMKDWMRGFNQGQGSSSSSLPPNQTISADILRSLVQLLQEAYTTLSTTPSPTNATVTATTSTLATLTLTVMKTMASWIDLSLLLDESVTGLWFAALKLSVDGGEAGMVAMQCFQELVGRGMETVKKIALLAETRVLERIHSAVNLETVDASPIDVVLEVAKFINLTGLELLPLLEELQHEASKTSDTNTKSMHASLQQQVNQTMDLFFRCFAFDDIDVSGAVLPFASRITFIPDLSAQEQQPQQVSCNVYAPQLLTIMYRQMRYPEEFTFEQNENEDEAEEEIYRIELRKLYQKLVRAVPNIALQFLCEALANLSEPLSGAPTPDMEACLRLVYHYCEGIRPPPGVKTVMKNSETFRNVLVALHRSDVVNHSHCEVLLLYYDIVVRYHAIFFHHPDLLPAVLQSLSGPRGLQFERSGRVRSRACYLLQKLVKSLAARKGVLRPFVETAVTGIQSFMVSFIYTNTTSSSDTATDEPSKPLRQEDALHLFETMGLLLGKTGLTPTEQQQSLISLMTPHKQSIQNALHSLQQMEQQNHVTGVAREQLGDQLAQAMAAITYLSKGFASPPPLEVQVVFAESLEVSLTILEALAQHDGVRRNATILFQRMIQCLGTNQGSRSGGVAAMQDRQEAQRTSLLLSKAPRFLSALIAQASSESDVHDAAQILNQVCIKFKEQAALAVDAAVLPFLQVCEALRKEILMEHRSDETSTTINGGSTSHFIKDDIILPPHIWAEQISIQKLSYLVLQHIATYKVSAVLESPANSPHLQSILNLMTNGVLGIDPRSDVLILEKSASMNQNNNHVRMQQADPIIQKTCVQFFRELVDQWGNASTEWQKQLGYTGRGLEDGGSRLLPGQQLQQQRQTFLRYVCEVLLPQIVQTLFASLDLSDANQSRLIAEISSLLYYVKMHCGSSALDTCMRSISSASSPPFPTPTGTLASFAANVCNASNSKEVEKCVKDLLKTSQVIASTE